MNNHVTRSAVLTAWVIALVIGVGWLPMNRPVSAQTDDHAAHAEHEEDTHDEHDDHAEHGEADEHEEHDAHDAEEGHDGHADQDDHDGHVDDGRVRIEPQMLEAFGIEVAPVGHGTLETVIELPGEVVFNADRIAHVTPNVPGIVERVEHSVGDHVEAGDLMAVLHSRELAEARSEYLSAQARLGLAKESLDRDEQLLADRVGTERQVLEARQAVREAEIALNLAEQNLHALGQDHVQIGALGEAEDMTFSAYELRAPIEGVVIERHLTRGERVGDDTDPTPFVIADLSSVWVNLTVYQRDLATVRPGMAVSISAGPGLASARGKVTFVSPSLDEHTRTATARVVLENVDGAWRPGMFVSAELEAGAGSAALVLQRSAVQEMDGRTVVFVEEDGAFEPRPVVIGKETGGRVEVLSGLSAGERVVTRNGFAIKAELNRGALEHAGHAH